MDGDNSTRHSALGTRHSLRALRELLRSSPLVPPEVRAHWLRVLPHLTAEQRGELAALLAGPTAAGEPVGGSAERVDSVPTAAEPAAPTSAAGRERPRPAR
jgi:hypothetical protein